MNWLLISSDEKNAAELSERVGENFPDSQKTVSLVNDETFSKIVKTLPEFTSCVIISDEIDEKLSYILGFFAARNLSVYTTLKNVEDFFLGSQVEIFENSECLFSFIEVNQQSILIKDKRRISYSYLFDNGIPFNADVITSYIEKGNRQICECFFDAGMSVDSKNSDGTSLLNVACRAEHFDFVKWFVSLGADIDPVSYDRGYTPLMDAVWKGNKKIAEFLIQQGADVNKVNKEGQTMIVLAVGQNNFELTKLLAENGADVDIPDGMGMSAYGYAELFKKQDLLDVLKKYHKE